MITTQKHNIQQISHFILYEWSQDDETYYRLMNCITDCRGNTESGLKKFMSSVTTGIFGSDNKVFHRLLEEMFPHLHKGVNDLWETFIEEDEIAQSLKSQWKNERIDLFRSYSSFD